PRGGSEPVLVTPEHDRRARSIGLEDPRCPVLRHGHDARAFVVRAEGREAHLGLVALQHDRRVVSPSVGGDPGRGSPTHVGGDRGRGSPTHVGGDRGRGSPTHVGGDRGRGSPTHVGGDRGRGSPTHVGGDRGRGSPTHVKNACCLVERRRDHTIA